MTVPIYVAQPPRADYVEDGVTLLRGVPYKFFDHDELTVKRIAVDGTETLLIILDVDYTVTGGAVDGVSRDRLGDDDQRRHRRRHAADRSQHQAVNSRSCGIRATISPRAITRKRPIASKCRSRSSAAI
jgi:hypothetical protein